MFDSLKVDFEDRVKEVDLYFQLLSAFDNDEITIVQGTGPQIMTIGSPPTEWGRMLKGAAYLVLYNLVEAFIRRGYQTVFDTIRNEGLSGSELTEQFRRQWIDQLNRKVKPFDGSPKVYMGIANKIVTDILAKSAVKLEHLNLPISGNLDATIIREICYLHGIDHNIPKEAKGGQALDTVKSKRNSLAHGDESFAECGRIVTSSELMEAKDEVVVYMRGIINNLEAFTITKGYKL